MVIPSRIVKKKRKKTFYPGSIGRARLCEMIIFLLDKQRFRGGALHERVRAAGAGAEYQRQQRIGKCEQNDDKLYRERNGASIFHRARRVPRYVPGQIAIGFRVKSDRRDPDVSGDGTIRIQGTRLDAFRIPRAYAL